MNPGNEKLDWQRLYAGLALIGLASKSIDPKALAALAFEISKAMVEEEGFNGAD